MKMGYQEQADFDAASGADEEERERRRLKSPQERWGCACPRIEARDCIAFRSRRSMWGDGDDSHERDEFCECHCHVLDDDDDDDDDDAPRPEAPR